METEPGLGNPGDQARVYFPPWLLMHFSPFYPLEIPEGMVVDKHLVLSKHNIEVQRRDCAGMSCSPAQGGR